MLLRYSVAYAIARGLPGIITLLAVAAYTRLLSPADYGYYALVLAAVSLANGALFYWLQVGLKRFAMRDYGSPEALLSTVLAAFAVLAGVLAIALLASFVIAIETELRLALLIGLVLLISQGFFEINIQLAASRLQPLLYGVLSIVRSVLALIFGVALVSLGTAWKGPLLGIAVAAAVSTLMFGMKNWFGASVRRPNRDAWRDLVRYGTPISVASLLSYASISLDRFLITYFLDRDAVGQYSASFEVANYAIQMAMVVVNLGAVPVIVRALEREGEHRARLHLAEQGVLLLVAALPIAVVCVVISDNVATVLLGSAFTSASSLLMPWLALASLLFGFRAYYLDLAFQLGERTDYQLWVAGVSLVIGLGLNAVLIPFYGVSGAAYAFGITSGLSVLVSGLLGRKVFHIPIPLAPYIRILGAGALMVVGLMPISALRGWEGLVLQLVVGGTVYALGLVLFNVAGWRNALLNTLRR